jgi:hypothetical protein
VAVCIPAVAVCSTCALFCFGSVVRVCDTVPQGWAAVAVDTATIRLHKSIATLSAVRVAVFTVAHTNALDESNAEGNITWGACLSSSLQAAGEVLVNIASEGSCQLAQLGISESRLRPALVSPDCDSVFVVADCNEEDARILRGAALALALASSLCDSHRARNDEGAARVWGTCRSCENGGVSLLAEP